MWKAKIYMKPKNLNKLHEKIYWKFLKVSFIRLLSDIKCF